jgi:RNA polymerase sigma factor (sigma-70 family)
VTSETARQRFTQSVMPHLDDAYTLAKWLTASAADAEDVVQDACIRALNALDATTVERPRPWLLAIVRNTAFTWLAKNRPKALIVVDDETLVAMMDSKRNAELSGAPESDSVALADGPALTAAIAALPQPFRETLVLREINGMSYHDISEVTGVPMGTVMSRLSRARALLLARLSGSAS